jgi:hypothetical protein
MLSQELTPIGTCPLQFRLLQIPSKTSFPLCDAYFQSEMCASVLKHEPVFVFNNSRFRFRAALAPSKSKQTKLKNRV